MKNLLAISIWLFLSLSFLVNGQSCSEAPQRVRLFVQALSGCDSVSYVQILIDGRHIHQEDIPELPIAGYWSQLDTKIEPGEREISISVPETGFRKDTIVHFSGAIDTLFVSYRCLLSFEDFSDPRIYDLFVQTDMKSNFRKFVDSIYQNQIITPRDGSILDEKFKVSSR